MIHIILQNIYKRFPCTSLCSSIQNVVLPACGRLPSFHRWQDLFRMVYGVLRWFAMTEWGSLLPDESITTNARVCGRKPAFPSSRCNENDLLQCSSSARSSGGGGSGSSSEKARSAVWSMVSLSLYIRVTALRT